MSRRATKPRPRAPHCLITPAIIQGQFRPRSASNSTIFEANCQRLWLAYAQARPRLRKLTAARLFAAVEANSSILHDLRPTRHKVVPYLIELAARSALWIREPEDFVPTDETPALQVVSLLRHLFARYPTPAWLETALVPRRAPLRHGVELGWFIHVAQGGNLRDAPHLPIALTSRASHFAMLAPAGLNPRDALLFGVLRAIGGRDELVQELLQCSRWLTLDEVWLKLYEKLLRAPEFPVHQVRPLTDYVRHRRFAHERRELFNLSTHTVRDLLSGMERWHAELRTAAARRTGVAFAVAWTSRLRAESLLRPCEHGDFSLAELCSARELFDEGSRMHHCVASYTRSCADGAMSIWSLRFRQNGTESGRVTIRVAVSERRVVEARRFANARIDARDLRIITDWARANGLSVVDGL
ncbi:MAG TPA: PcfJ domain-containing protein [Polyangiaceae bacterium]|nr:PcfJ domain-containing protein [Polyangiaceae bacterium]